MGIRLHMVSRRAMATVSKLKNLIRGQEAILGASTKNSTLRTEIALPLGPHLRTIWSGKHSWASETTDSMSSRLAPDGHQWALMSMKELPNGQIEAIKSPYPTKATIISVKQTLARTSNNGARSSRCGDLQK